MATENEKALQLYKDRKEFQIRSALIRQGVERKIADAVIGYKPDQVPFIYMAGPMKVLIQRTRDNWSEGDEMIPGLSSLWIGTTDAIHNLHNENGWSDQIPEVIVQWRGQYLPEGSQHEAKTSISRTEIKHLGDGRFVLVEYVGVGAMGAFDGTIDSIALYTPNGTFVPGGYTKQRTTYDIYHFSQIKRVNLKDVPGALLANKDEESEGWSLEPRSPRFPLNASGTTLLNGYEEMLAFHMHDLSPFKEDYAKARRFSALPEPKTQSVIPASPGHQFHLILNEQTAISRDRVLEVMPDALDLMKLIAPKVLRRLAKNIDTHGTISMEIDGILNHPDKMWILNTMLEQFTREQRFNLARFVAKKINDGSFTAWIKSLQEPDGTKFVNDAINRNTQHLLAWFKRCAPANTDLKDWIKTAKDAAIIGGEVALESSAYNRCFNGMITSFVERYIEYVGQQYFGHTLE